MTQKISRLRRASVGSAGPSCAQNPADRRGPALLTTSLIAALALGGCVSGAAPRDTVTPLPSTFVAQPEGQSITTLDQWWTLYQDPQLTALVERALQQGYSVREALARLDEARALRSVALSQFNPQGNLSANGEYRETQDLSDDNGATANPLQSSAGGSRTASVSLPVSWELDLFGRRATTARAGDADLAAAAFDVEAARAAIAAEVARSLFQARGFAAQYDEALETRRIQRELLRVLTERAERGLAATSEADRVAADLAQAEAQAADLEAALTASRRALLAVVGDASLPLTYAPILPDLGEVPEAPSALPSDLLERRPDIRLAQARIDRAAANVRLAELAFFPRFTLNPGVGLSAQRGSFDSTTSFWSIGAGLALPILDRPRLSAQLGAEGARAEQSVLAYERTVQIAFSEADQALVRLEADRRRVATLTDGETRGRRAYDAARIRYDLGFANLQELLDAERAWRATRSALTGARLDALQRSVQVFQTLGGGWSPASAPQGSRS